MTIDAIVFESISMAIKNGVWFEIYVSKPKIITAARKWFIIRSVIVIQLQCISNVTSDDVVYYLISDNSCRQT